MTPLSEQRSERVYRLTRGVKRSTLYAILATGGVLMCFPFVWMLLTSFKTYAEAIATPPTIFPNDWGLRVAAAATMVRIYPWTVAVFVLWVGAGWIALRRLDDRTVRALLMVLYVAAFFVVADLARWGQWQMSELYAVAKARMGIDLEPLWQNYVDAWDRAPFAHYFRNSLLVSTLTPLAIILTSAPAAYAFARLEFPGQGLIFMLYLATMMVPSEVILIPNFITISQLGWRNTYLALIMPYSVSVISIFFLRQFFRSVPNDLYDAAVIDGSGHVRFLLSIAMPLARPALVSTALFNFLGSWNALLWPLLVTDKEEMRPIALGLASFSTEAGMQAQLYMAAASFSIIPVLILFLFVQEEFIAGIARTGIK